MKKFLAAIVLSLVFLTGCLKPAPVIPPIQQSAEHMLLIMDDTSDDPLGLCSATAIGKHALLTAQHCNYGDKHRKIRIDYSMTDYTLVAAATDGRDHVIYIIDGPEFDNIIPYSTTTATVGDEVYMYGNGQGTYPSRKLSGTVLSKFDPSDVNAKQGMIYIDFEAIPGDSGGIIYDSGNNMVAVLTYQMPAHSVDIWGNPVTISAAFSLNFTSAQIDYAQNYEKGKTHADSKQNNSGFHQLGEAHELQSKPRNRKFPRTRSHSRTNGHASDSVSSPKLVVE